MSAMSAWFLVMYLEGVSTLPMQTREACLSAAQVVQQGKLYAMCVSSDGSVAKPDNNKR